MKKPLLLVSLMSLALLPRLTACPVPVFRYALERWPPDRFQLTLLHKGMPQEEVDAWLDPVYNAQMGEYAQDLREEPLREDASEELKQEAAKVTEEDPRFVLQYPRDYYFAPPILMSGKADAAMRKQILESPIRNEIEKRILSKDSAVWVLIPGADEEVNQRLRNLLTEEIEELNRVLELPQSMVEIYSPERQEEVKKALPIRFSMLELNRDDPEELLMRKTIQDVAGEEWADQDLAWVMPVFGQGRALAIEPSTSFNASILREMAYFLAGSCSCEVKELNPGFDLFIVEPWMEDLERSFVEESREPPQLFNPIAYEPEPEPESEPVPETESAEAPAGNAEPTPAPEPVEPDMDSESSSVSWAVLMGGAVVILLGAGFAIGRKGGGDA